MNELLQYDRLALADGEFWRIITCHWTHWSLEHLVWDALALIILASVCWVRSPVRTVATIVASMLTIPCVLWVVQPDLIYYRGLSGIDTALFALLAGSLWHQGRGDARKTTRIAVAFFGLLLAAKIGWEMYTASAFFVDLGSVGVVPVPAAHVTGVIVGLLCLWRRRWISRISHPQSAKRLVTACTLPLILTAGFWLLDSLFSSCLPAAGVV